MHMKIQETDVVIIGGAATGLMLAIELGCRGIPCIVLEQSDIRREIPKANAISARTMEHFRRRGFSDRIRALGLPADHPQDVVYCTRITGYELARFRIPSRNEAVQRNSLGDFDSDSWATPELPHRAQQMFVEPVMMDELGRYPSIELRMGSTVTGVQDDGGGVVVVVESTDRLSSTIRAKYAVGCDGAHSIVRNAIGASYVGLSGEAREFFGGRMMGIFFESEALKKMMTPAWQYWIANVERRGGLISIDGQRRFLTGIQLAEGQDKDQIDIQEVLYGLVGQPIDYQVISTSCWTAGLTLVADTYRRGRLLIAGDAAHLFTPAAGMGFNTAMDDAVNLGWKLTAVLRGWSGERLLDTYQTERKPIGLRNTAYARVMADSMAQLRPPLDIEADGDEGEKARGEYARICHAHIRREFNIPGLQLGLRYESEIIAKESASPPPDDPNVYVPTGYPGARAPFVPTLNGASFDEFGQDFTLLVLCDVDVVAWKNFAAENGIPLQVYRSVSEVERKYYEADLALIRPDHHIAWRGMSNASPGTVLSMAVGS